MYVCTCFSFIYLLFSQQNIKRGRPRLLHSQTAHVIRRYLLWLSHLVASSLPFDLFFFLLHWIFKKPELLYFFLIKELLSLQTFYDDSGLAFFALKRAPCCNGLELHIATRWTFKCIAFKDAIWLNSTTRLLLLQNAEWYDPPPHTHTNTHIAAYIQWRKRLYRCKHISKDSPSAWWFTVQLWNWQQLAGIPVLNV